MTKYTVQFDDSQKVVSVTYSYVWEDVEVEANSEEEAKRKALQLVKDGEVEYYKEESNGWDADYTAESLRTPTVPEVNSIEEAEN